MSKFEVTLINPKNPFDINLIEKRIGELGGNTYQDMFEVIDCDNENHADHTNKVTLDLSASTMELDCCCMAFEDKIKSELGRNKGRK